MIPYKSVNRDAGAVAYAIGENHIDVQFKNGAIYRYDHDRPDKEKVEKMKRLAATGVGLSTFINQHVREKYAMQLRS